MLTGVAVLFALAMPRAVVDNLYGYLFQLRPNIEWREALRDRAGLFEPKLLVYLKQAALSSALDFDPFLDSYGGAQSYSVLQETEGADRASIVVRIHAAHTPLGPRDRKVTVELVRGEEWKIQNFRYHWASPDDLVSYLKRNRIVDGL